VVLEQQVHRRAVAEDVDIRADDPVGIPGYRRDD